MGYEADLVQIHYALQDAGITYVDAWHDGGGRYVVELDKYVRQPYDGPRDMIMALQDALDFQAGLGFEARSEGRSRIVIDG